MEPTTEPSQTEQLAEPIRPLTYVKMGVFTLLFAIIFAAFFLAALYIATYDEEKHRQAELEEQKQLEIQRYQSTND